MRSTAMTALYFDVQMFCFFVSCGSRLSDVSCMCDLSNVSGTITSQTSDLHLAHDINVLPSGHLSSLNYQSNP